MDGEGNFHRHLMTAPVKQLPATKLHQSVLNDLAENFSKIVISNLTGGREEVFGSSATTIPNRIGMFESVSQPSSKPTTHHPNSRSEYATHLLPLSQK
jgi:hypothetical protein